MIEKTVEKEKSWFLAFEDDIIHLFEAFKGQKIQTGLKNLEEFSSRYKAKQRAKEINPSWRE